MTSRRTGGAFARARALGLLTLLLTAAHHAQAGKPSITWTPSAIDATIGNGAGATGDRVITVASSTTLANVDLWVTPEVSGFLSLEPSHLATMTAGTAYAVKVRFMVPPHAVPGLYDGTVHVRSGSQTIPQPLKVLINLDYGNISIPPSTHVLSGATTAYLTSVAADSEWWPGAVTGATFRGMPPGHHTYAFVLDGVVVGSGGFDLTEGTPVTVYAARPTGGQNS